MFPVASVRCVGVQSAPLHPAVVVLQNGARPFLQLRPACKRAVGPSRKRSLIKPYAYIPPFPPEAYSALYNEVKKPVAPSNGPKTPSLLQRTAAGVSFLVGLLGFVAATWWATNFTASAVRHVLPWDPKAIGFSSVLEKVASATQPGEQLSVQYSQPTRLEQNAVQVTEVAREPSRGILHRVINLPGGIVRLGTVVLDKTLGLPSPDNARTIIHGTAVAAPTSATSLGDRSQDKQPVQAQVQAVAVPPTGTPAAPEATSASPFPFTLRLDHETTALAITIITITPCILLSFLVAVKMLAQALAKALTGQPSASAAAPPPTKKPAGPSSSLLTSRTLATSPAASVGAVHPVQLGEDTIKLAEDVRAVAQDTAALDGQVITAMTSTAAVAAAAAAATRDPLHIRQHVSEAVASARQAGQAVEAMAGDYQRLAKDAHNMAEDAKKVFEDLKGDAPAPMVTSAPLASQPVPPPVAVAAGVLPSSTTTTPSSAPSCLLSSAVPANPAGNPQAATGTLPLVLAAPIMAPVSAAALAEPILAPISPAAPIPLEGPNATAAGKHTDAVAPGTTVGNLSTTAASTQMNAATAGTVPPAGAHTPPPPGPTTAALQAAAAPAASSWGPVVALAGGAAAGAGAVAAASMLMPRNAGSQPATGAVGAEDAQQLVDWFEAEDAALEAVAKHRQENLARLVQALKAEGVEVWLDDLDQQVEEAAAEYGHVAEEAEEQEEGEAGAAEEAEEEEYEEEVSWADAAKHYEGRMREYFRKNVELTEEAAEFFCPDGELTEEAAQFIYENFEVAEEGEEGEGLQEANENEEEEDDDPLTWFVEDEDEEAGADDVEARLGQDEAEESWPAQEGDTEAEEAEESWPVQEDDAEAEEDEESWPAQEDDAEAEEDYSDEPVGWGRLLLPDEDPIVDEAEAERGPMPAIDAKGLFSDTVPASCELHDAELEGEQSDGEGLEVCNAQETPRAQGEAGQGGDPGLADVASAAAAVTQGVWAAGLPAADAGDLQAAIHHLVERQVVLDTLEVTAPSTDLQQQQPILEMPPAANTDAPQSPRAESAPPVASAGTEQLLGLAASPLGCAAARGVEEPAAGSAVSHADAPSAARTAGASADVMAAAVAAVAAGAAAVGATAGAGAALAAGPAVAASAAAGPAVAAEAAAAAAGATVAGGTAASVAATQAAAAIASALVGASANAAAPANPPGQALQAEVQKVLSDASSLEAYPLQELTQELSQLCDARQQPTDGTAPMTAAVQLATPRDEPSARLLASLMKEASADANEEQPNPISGGDAAQSTLKDPISSGAAHTVLMAQDPLAQADPLTRQMRDIFSSLPLSISMFTTLDKEDLLKHAERTLAAQQAARSGPMQTCEAQLVVQPGQDERPPKQAGDAATGDQPMPAENSKQLEPVKGSAELLAGKVAEPVGMEPPSTPMSMDELDESVTAMTPKLLGQAADAKQPDQAKSSADVLEEELAELFGVILPRAIDAIDAVGKSIAVVVPEVVEQAFQSPQAKKAAAELAQELQELFDGFDAAVKASDTAGDGTHAATKNAPEAAPEQREVVDAKDTPEKAAQEPQDSVGNEQPQAAATDKDTPEITAPGPAREPSKAAEAMGLADELARELNDLFGSVLQQATSQQESGRDRAEGVAEELSRELSELLDSVLPRTFSALQTAEDLITGKGPASVHDAARGLDRATSEAAEELKGAAADLTRELADLFGTALPDALWTLSGIDVKHQAEQAERPVMAKQTAAPPPAQPDVSLQGTATPAAAQADALVEQDTARADVTVMAPAAGASTPLTASSAPLLQPAEEAAAAKDLAASAPAGQPAATPLGSAADGTLSKPVMHAEAVAEPTPVLDAAAPPAQLVPDAPAHNPPPDTVQDVERPAAAVPTQAAASAVHGAKAAAAVPAPGPSPLAAVAAEVDDWRGGRRPTEIFMGLMRAEPHRFMHFLYTRFAPLHHGRGLAGMAVPEVTRMYLERPRLMEQATKEYMESVRAGSAAKAQQAAAMQPTEPAADAAKPQIDIRFRSMRDVPENGGEPNVARAAAADPAAPPQEQATMHAPVDGRGKAVTSASEQLLDLPETFVELEKRRHAQHAQHKEPELEASARPKRPLTESDAAGGAGRAGQYVVPETGDCARRMEERMGRVMATEHIMAMVEMVDSLHKARVEEVARMPPASPGVAEDAAARSQLQPEATPSVPTFEASPLAEAVRGGEAQRQHKQQVSEPQAPAAPKDAESAATPETRRSAPPQEPAAHLDDANAGLRSHPLTDLPGFRRAPMLSRSDWRRRMGSRVLLPGARGIIGSDNPRLLHDLVVEKAQSNALLRAYKAREERYQQMLRSRPAVIDPADFPGLAPVRPQEVEELWRSQRVASEAAVPQDVEPARPREVEQAPAVQVLPSPPPLDDLFRSAIEVVAPLVAPGTATNPLLRWQFSEGVVIALAKLHDKLDGSMPVERAVRVRAAKEVLLDMAGRRSNAVYSTVPTNDWLQAQGFPVAGPTSINFSELVDLLVQVYTQSMQTSGDVDEHGRPASLLCNGLDRASALHDTVRRGTAHPGQLGVLETVLGAVCIAYDDWQATRMDGERLVFDQVAQVHIGSEGRPWLPDLVSEVFSRAAKTA